MAVDLLAGVWTYRSFLNLPRPVEDFNEIRFGQGELVIAASSDPGTLRGQLALRSSPPKPDDPRLALGGSIQFGNPLTVHLQGVGVAGTRAAGWIYDYVAYLVPHWPNGKGQQPTLVGSVMRAVPHDGQPAGFVGSFVAVQNDFLEPRLVIPLPEPAVKMLASKHHRLHHAVWHGTRNGWLSASLSEEKREQIRKLGWQPGGKEERPAVRAGAPLVGNGSGEDFLFMHRQMIREVNAKAKEAGQGPISGWPFIPPPDVAVLEPDFSQPNPTLSPGNPDGFAVPPAWVDPDDEVTNRRIAWLKSDGHYWSRMRWWDREFKNPQYLSQLTLGELGALLEFSVHNDMHMRWASVPRDPRDGSLLPAGRPANDVRDFWDDPKYDFLGEFYSSHVNPVFWRLHGWIDDRIEDWFAAHQGEVERTEVGGLPWFKKGDWVHTDAPWAGPDEGGHGHGHGGMPHYDVEKMKQVNAILFGPSPAEAAPAALAVARAARTLRQTTKPHWF